LQARTARQLIALDKTPLRRRHGVSASCEKANRIFYRADGTAKTIGDSRGRSEYPDVQSIQTTGSRLRCSAIRRPRRNAPIGDASFVSDTCQNDPAPFHPAAGEKIRLPAALRPSMGWSSLEANPPAPSPMLPQSPLLLSPGVVEILASLGPAGESRNKRAGS
jgi:hypothetical protein